MDLQAVRATAETIARRAGDELMRFRAQPLHTRAKSNIYDLVTEADVGAEALIIRALSEAFPDHAIVGEEGGRVKGVEGAYTWYVDPLDGTMNFAHGLPLFAVSLGLAAPDGGPVVGAVYAPALGELFSAARGRGATLNGEPIHVSATDSLERALLVTGFTSNKTVAMENMPVWTAFMQQARDVRRLGSAAIDLAYVAAGRLEAFWEPHIFPWDVMGGLALVEAAGGRATDYAGGTDRLYTGEEIIASNGLLHDDILRLLNEALAGS